MKARLEIYLLGPFHVSLDGETLTWFESDKVRALLAYLAVESDRPHRREALAGLLWPDSPESSARTNLRSALANLRDVIGDRSAEPPFLDITRQTIRLNPEENSWLDVGEFLHLSKSGGSSSLDPNQLVKAVDLYRGEFLQGFYVKDSSIFDEWAAISRERYHARALETLRHLSAYQEGRGDYEQGGQYAQRWLELEPWDEGGHRQLMRLFSLNGQRNAALAQYELCQNVLNDELGVETSPETDDLYQRILGGEFAQELTDPRDWIIRGFELHESLGKGSFGEVYRAHQQLIDRDVAIKIILPKYANHPDFIRRFEFEAQIAARLEHPHIVPLYDYWREPDGAFLVMRWMRGGSLANTIGERFWEPPEIIKFVDQLAGALAFAHISGVVHQDIKPANILLDENRNAYLSDFGIAALIGSTGTPFLPEMKFDGGSTESPVFKSPELFRGGETTPQADIYSFGVLLYLLLTGAFPFQELSGQELISTHLSEPLPSVHERRLDIPPAVDNVIRKATAKDPGDRYPDTLALAKDFRNALHTEVYDHPRNPIQNPYKGLRAFQEADAGDFFGREALVDELASILGRSASRCLAVVGPSGCGKSSVVNAGLIPALRASVISGSENWFITKMAPRANPMENLIRALLSVGVEIPDNLLHLDDGKIDLAQVLDQLLPDDERVSEN